MKDELKILNQPDSSHPFLIVYKPRGIPSAPLREDDFSALSFASSLFPEIKKINGRKSVEYGLIHRIDTETAGLILIALTQAFYDFMMEEQKNGRFEKWYRAEISRNDKNERLDGFPEIEQSLVKAFLSGEKVTVTSSFRSFGPKGKEVRPVDKKSGRAALKKSSEQIYSTDFILVCENTVEAHIVAGYRHQVRCHLAWLGFPIMGDKIYNSSLKNACEAVPMEFTAFKFSFRNPETQMMEVFEI